LPRKIDHIGIAVRSLEDALRVYTGGFGLEVAKIERIPDQETRVALLPVGESRLELLEATSAESPVARFLATRGEGIHHVCFQVDDVVAEIKRLKENGVQLIDERPRKGADGCMIAFIHPKDAAGVLIELSQPPGGANDPMVE